MTIRYFVYSEILCTLLGKLAHTITLLSRYFRVISEPACIFSFSYWATLFLWNSLFNARRVWRHLVWVYLAVSLRNKPWLCDDQNCKLEWRILFHPSCYPHRSSFLLQDVLLLYSQDFLGDESGSWKKWLCFIDRKASILKITE